MNKTPIRQEATYGVQHIRATDQRESTMSTDQRESMDGRNVTKFSLEMVLLIDRDRTYWQSFWMKKIIFLRMIQSSFFVGINNSATSCPSRSRSWLNMAFCQRCD